MSRLRFGLLLVSAMALGACSAASEATNSSDMSSGLPLSGEAPMFPGFSYDTGLLPKVSPAQVSFKASMGGALKVSARGHAASGKLEGNKGSGKLAIDLHAKLEGHLKVTSTFKNYDGDIPGLKDLDIAATAEAPFDPFLLGDGEEANATANVPETKLPDVPLSGVPGHLELTVLDKTTITATLHGSCLRGAESKATFSGATTMSGTLVLGAKLVLDLPAPLDKSVDLPEIAIDLPVMNGTIDASSPEAGIADFTAGSCSDAPAPADPSAPAASTDPAAGGACNDLTNVGSAVEYEYIKAPLPAAEGGTIQDGTYTLLAIRGYQGAPYVSTDVYKRTIRIAGGHFDGVVDVSGEVSRNAATYVARGTTLTRTFGCPESTPEDVAQYSATSSTLTLLYPDDNVTYTYGKQ